MTGSAIWPWVIPVMETFALLSVVAATAALPPVRRRCYYVFYRAHLALPFLVLASLAHSWDAWQYALPGLLLYVADKLEAPRPVSNTRSHSPTLAPHLTPHRLPPPRRQALVRLLSQRCLPSRRVRIVSIRSLGNDVVAIELAASDGGAAVAPGQVVYLNIPAVSPLQFHPFTASETGAVLSGGGGGGSGAIGGGGGGGGGTWTHHIKVTGSRRWTSRLNDLVVGKERGRRGQWHTASPPPTVRVLGPFGGTDHLAAAAAPAQLLVAGGVGITPISALAAALLHRHHRGGELHAAAPSRLVFVWVVREAALLREFAPLLAALDAPDVAVRLFLTGKDAAAAAPAASHDDEAPPPPALPPQLSSLVERSRPDAALLLPTLVADDLGAAAHHLRSGGKLMRVSAFVCGPPALEASVKDACDRCCAAGVARVALTSLNFEL